jgi:hypothetical protein
MTQTIQPDQVALDEAAERGELIYRFEGNLSDLYPIGIFPEGIRFHNEFSARITAGPFTGGRVFGVDHFMLRPDGVGVIVAPEVIEHGDRRVVGDVRGYVVPPEGAPVPPLEAVLDPSFEWPDVPFRVTGSVLLRTAAAELDHLNRTVAVIEGTVVLATGELKVEARAVPAP